MRQITMVARPVNRPEDLTGVKIRVPPGQMIADTFTAFGAEPVITPANLIYDSIKTGKVTAQENPLAVLEGFRIFELVKYVSMTNHMWSGFNQMAHLPTWRALPADVQDIITRNVTKFVRQQRVEQGALNAALRDQLSPRGLCSTRWTRHRSARGSAPSTPPGKTNSVRKAGPSWRRRWANSGRA